MKFIPIKFKDVPIFVIFYLKRRWLYKNANQQVYNGKNEPIEINLDSWVGMDYNDAKKAGLAI